MPTGYTSPLYEGKEISFEQFALRCARNFGALVMMREEPLDTPIPEKFNPCEYCKREYEAGSDIQLEYGIKDIRHSL